MLYFHNLLREPYFFNLQAKSNTIKQTMSSCYDVFAESVHAIREGELIVTVSATDKEYHFQNWFQARLDHLSLNYDELGRNTYPDFRLVNTAEGYEVKGLTTSGRDKSHDSNSRVPAGHHKGRTIFYVFGLQKNHSSGKLWEANLKIRPI